MKIRIDSSKVTGIVAGSAKLDRFVFDTWYFKNIEVESGKIYALVSECGQGCMYLSYLLGGRVSPGELIVYKDGNCVSQDELSKIAWNLEPIKEKYKNKTLRKTIEKALVKNECAETFEEIADTFYLDARKDNVKLRYLSGARWRASAAVGYVNGRRIFFAPYENTSFYHSMYGSHLFDVLRWLVDKDNIILLPVGSDAFIKSVVDECIYLDPQYG